RLQQPDRLVHDRPDVPQPVTDQAADVDDRVEVDRGVVFGEGADVADPQVRGQALVLEALLGFADGGRGTVHAVRVETLPRQKPNVRPHAAAHLEHADLLAVRHPGVVAGDETDQLLRRVLPPVAAPEDFFPGRVPTHRTSFPDSGRAVRLPAGGST